MTEKEVMKFVIERSNDPIIKNPVLREAMNKDLGPRPMFGQGSSVDSAVRTVDPVQDSGNKIEEVLKAYELYRKNRSGKRPMKFKTFFEEYGKENFATGGQAGQLVSNTVDGSRPGYSGKLALKVTQALNKIIPYKGATTIGTSSPKLSRKPELNFIKLFNQLKDTNFSGNLRKTSESINQSPERIKGILNRTLGPGSKSSGHKPVISIPEPKNGILYSQTTTNMKSNPDAFRELITPQTKNLYLSPRDIASKLGINFRGDKGQYDFFVKDLKDLKVTNKSSSGNQKFFNFNDATNKILNKYKTKKIKGERLAESNRLEIEMKLDPELYRIRSNNKQTIKTISKDENIYLKNSIDDLGHTVSIKVTDKYPKLFKNSNVNRINSLVYQDPYLNQDVMKLTGYETRFGSMFEELETLVNKPVTAKTQKKILDIKQSMDQNYNGLIKNLTNPVALKYIMKRSGKEISPSHLKTLSQQGKKTNRIPKIDVKVPKIGEKFLSENIYADMSKVDPKYIMGYVNQINPTAKKFTDLSLSEQALYKANLLDQSGMIVRDYYKKVGYPKEQLDELQEAVTFDRYASGGEVKRTGFADGSTKSFLQKIGPVIKGDAYIAAADMVNNWTKGQGFLRGLNNAVDSGTFGLIDTKADEHALLEKMRKDGATKEEIQSVKDWAKYMKLYNTYTRSIDYLEEAKETLARSNAGEIIGPDDRMLLESRVEQEPKRVARLAEEFEKSQENINLGKGYKLMNEYMERLAAEDWNKTAGTPFDRGYREMLGAKGDEGIIWGPQFGNPSRGIFNEGREMKKFKPQSVMNYHPVYGYKEDLKKEMRRGNSPMEDINDSMNEFYPSPILINEGSRGDFADALGMVNKNFKKIKKSDGTEEIVDMGIYDYEDPFAKAEGGIMNLMKKYND
jgi:hypothetical protein